MVGDVLYLVNKLRNGVEAFVKNNISDIKDIFRKLFQKIFNIFRFIYRDLLA